MTESKEESGIVICHILECLERTKREEAYEIVTYLEKLLQRPNAGFVLYLKHFVLVPLKQRGQKRHGWILIDQCQTLVL